MSQEPLRKSIGDARLLLGYAAESGRTLDQSIVDAIIAAERSINTPAGCTPTEEGKFWPEFARLAATLAPVTVSSLTATLEPTPPPAGANWLQLLRRELFAKTLAARAVGSFFRWTMIALITLLAVQFTWYLANSMLDEYRRTQKLLTGQTEQLNALAASARDESAAAEISELTAAAEHSESVLAATIQYGTRLLPDWLRPEALDEVLAGGDHLDPNSLSEDQWNRIRIQYEKSLAYLIEALQFYVLPLLYGALGAYIYVLRSLVRDIRERIYTASSDTLYSLRVTLGAVSGLAIGWILDPKTAIQPQGSSAEGGIQLGTLSPFALAFVAGYGVELLFSLLDNIVAAFAKRPDAQPATK